MTNFLIVYNRPCGHVDRLEEFASPVEAMYARFGAEESCDFDSNYEVVVISAKDENALRRSHSRYFLEDVGTVAV
ncbi:hypothetical protein [Jannaschia sp. R86511]|uniref:hypothetical protein n=1 Tax=Jannaschia sp. R86511 TaxID=3093853 RepID=UPI0036D313E7